MIIPEKPPSGSDGKKRADIQPGLWVAIVQKQDQRSGKRTEGMVKTILTGSSFHPHGIKVRLTSGHVGRVTMIIKKDPGVFAESNDTRLPDTPDL
ncbi:MAG: YwbE family protein [Methanospirillaceae archaeon]|nr:YwbE family protein [Methanospirillaceae archaeon]